jgi:ABC-2 type transport system permease protein
MSLMSGSNEDGGYTSSTVKVAVIDRDGSALSKGIRDYLYETGTAVEVEDDEDAIKDALYWRTVRYVVILPKGMEDAVKQYQNKVSDSDKFADKLGIVTKKLEESESTVFEDEKIEQYLTILDKYLMCGYEIDEALEATTKSLEHTVDVSVYRTDGDFNKTSMSKIAYFFSYVPYLLLSVGIMSITMLMLFFYEEDVKKRSVCSSMRLKSQNIQITMASLLFMLGLFCILIMVAMIFYGTEDIFCVNGVFYIINMFAFGLVSMSIAALLGNLLKTRNAVIGACNVVGLGFCFLGGIFVPMEIMPKNVLLFSRLFPTYWYTKNNNLVATMGRATGDFLREYGVNLGIELLFAIVFLCFALVCSRRRMVF